jgi:hypothetical protein
MRSSGSILLRRAGDFLRRRAKVPQRAIFVARPVNFWIRSRRAVLLFKLDPANLLTLLALPFARPPPRTVRDGATGPALITVLGQTSRLQIAFGLAWHLPSMHPSP